MYLCPEGRWSAWININDNARPNSKQTVYSPHRMAPLLTATLVMLRVLARTEAEAVCALSDQDLEVEEGKPIAKMWFVSNTFEAVCSVEEDEENEDGETIPGKCRPLVAIDFGHATWIEYVPQPDGTKTKELRFVSFPPVIMDKNGVTRPKKGEEGTFGLEDETEGRVKTLPIPDELDIDKVETINLDQSQGAILLSVEGGKVFILCYD
jgi:hypothetical protein